MSIQLGKSSTRRDWFRIGSSAAETISQALILGKDGFSSCISALFRTIEGIKGDKSVELIAEVFISNSLVFSITKILSSDFFDLDPNIEQSQEILRQVLTEYEHKANSGEYFLEGSHIEYPNKCAIIAELGDFVYEKASFLGTTHSLEEFRIQFFEGVVAGFLHVRMRDPVQFEP